MTRRALIVVFLTAATLLGAAVTAEAGGGFYFGFGIGWGRPAHFPHPYYYGGYHSYGYRVYAWTPYPYYYGPVARYHYYPVPRYRVYRSYVPAPAYRHRDGRNYGTYVPRAYGRVYHH